MRAYAQENTKTVYRQVKTALKKTEILYYRKMAEKMIIENESIEEYTNLIKERINDINGYLSRAIDSETQSALLEQRSCLRAEYRALMYRRRVFMRAWKKLTEEERTLLSELCKREYYEKLGGIYRQEEKLGYSQSTVYRKKQEALRHFAKLLMYYRQDFVRPKGSALKPAKL